MGLLLVLVVILGVVLLIGVVASLRVVQQYEKGIVFRLGRIQRGVREPGMTAIVPFIDRMQKVNMQIITMGVPGQDGITHDNVSVRVDAVVYFRVIDPIKAVVNVQNYLFAVSQVAQTSLRQVIGRADLDDLLAEREKINAELRHIIDEITEGPWGILIDRVSIKDVSLPEGMKRSMSAQAEAERDRRARIISADGEFQASKRLAAAAHEMAKDPAALQLRLLQTVTDVASERNSTLVMPIPVELLRFFDRAAGLSSPEGEDAVTGAEANEPPELKSKEEALNEPVPIEKPPAVEEPPAVEAPPVAEPPAGATDTTQAFGTQQRPPFS